ncbi:uncharacterized protein N7484_010413 [Penicillium longicatenatum]|uniref:uncharacterized protein n=1 Tax=Penicillium longicatenatum TaxID=1561947 RepID=UPI002548336A|nr:uncharacterized protein N7484_010413 [Penicillium longicatenatum]KAJ5630313.1 hypothetical protein N7484_010413 [Penicillium longicatenatum]
MSADIPTVADLKQAVEAGQRITPADVSMISHAESVLTGRGPLRGGPAEATAQSLAMRQMNFDAQLDEVSRKPQSHITHEDAREMQATEGRAFGRPPGRGSVSEQVRSIADRNEILGLPVVPTEVSVYVTKDDAREAQRAESMLYGGQTPRQGMAAQMQSAADKIENVRREEPW